MGSRDTTKCSDNIFCIYGTKCTIIYVSLSYANFNRPDEAEVRWTPKRISWGGLKTRTGLASMAQLVEASFYAWIGYWFHSVRAHT